MIFETSKTELSKTVSASKKVTLSANTTYIPIDLQPQTFRTLFAELVVMPRKRAPHLNDTLRSLIEIKNNRKRQINTEVQDQTINCLCLTHQYEMKLKWMELEAGATKRAHERWMKDCDLELHRNDVKRTKARNGIIDEIDEDFD